MSLYFSSRGTNYINVGSGSTIDNYTAMTYLGWFYFTDLSANDYGLIGLGTFAAGQDRKDFSVNTSAGVLDMVVDRATTDMRCQCNWSPAALTWYFLAMSWANNGTLPRLYLGSLSQLASEPSTYNLQDDGSGAIGDSTANSFYLGNIGLADRSLIGLVGPCQVYNRGLSAGEVRHLQYNLLSDEKVPLLAGCVGAWVPGKAGVKNHWDYSGNRNWGAVTGGVPHKDPPVPASRQRQRKLARSPSGIFADLPAARFTLAPLAPTAAKAAALTIGLVKFTPVAPTASKFAALPAGLLDLTAVAPIASHTAAAGQGLIDLLPVAPASAKSAAAGQGLVDLLGVAPAAAFTASAGVGLVDFTGVAPAASKAAASGQGLIDFVAPAVTEGIQAALPVAGIDFVGVAPATAKTAAGGIGLVDLSAVAPVTVKSAASGVGLIDLTAVAPATAKVAPGGLGLIDFVSPSLGGGISASLPSAGIDFLAVSPATTKAVAAGIGAMDLSAAQQTAGKQAASGLGLIDLTAAAAIAAKTALAGIGFVELVSVQPGTAKQATLAVGIVRLFAVALVEPLAFQPVLYSVSATIYEPGSRSAVVYESATVMATVYEPGSVAVNQSRTKAGRLVE